MKEWSREVVERRQLDWRKATGEGLRRDKGPREWRMTEGVTFQWAEKKSQCVTGLATPNEVLCGECF